MDDGIRGAFVFIAMTVGMALCFFSCVSGVLFLVQDDNLRRGRIGALFRVLPSVAILSRSTCRLMVLGHLALGLGVALDPEGLPAYFASLPLAELTLLLWSGWIVAVFMDWKMVGWRGRKSVAGALLGFVMVLAMWSVQVVDEAVDPGMPERRPGDVRQVHVLVDDATAVTSVVGDQGVGMD
jgi:ABC-type uncharacterized transport system permease subunit